MYNYQANLSDIQEEFDVVYIYLSLWLDNLLIHGCCDEIEFNQELELSAKGYIYTDFGTSEG